MAFRLDPYLRGGTGDQVRAHRENLRAPEAAGGPGTAAELGGPKPELAEKISEALRLPAGKAEAIVNAIFDSMVKALERGEGIEIRGFGSFTVRKYKAYEGRNPRTGETVAGAEERRPSLQAG